MVESVGLLICVPLWIVAALFTGASITAGLFFIHVAVVPLIFKYSKTFRRGLVFANFVQWPLFIDYEDPAANGIEGGRNLSIKYHSKVDNCRVKIGIWHILPKSGYERLKGSFVDNIDKEELNRRMDEELANSKNPIMMYCHGNSNSRGARHRISLYKFFQKMDYHTIAFDYRGYGDSTRLSPTEAGVVEDSLVVYEWLLNIANKDKRSGDGNMASVFVWGHSLGTGISSNLLGNLEHLSTSLLERPSPLPLPRGLILEAPFNNLADEVAHHPLSKLVTWLPYYDTTFVEPFRTEKDFKFLSDQHLSRQNRLPILILHAKDDIIVPFIVGLKLYRSIVAARSKSDACIKLHVYDEKLSLGHKWICNAPDLHTVIGVLLATGASLTASVFFVQVAVLPLLFKYSKSVQRKIVFSNCFNYPRNLDYENPSSVDIVGGRNFTIKFDSKVDNVPIKLGVWHMIPCSMFREVFVIRDYTTVDRRLHNDLTQTSNTIVLYCHGNSNHRASPYRLHMYKVFQELNFHVIAFDYRGYGDSTMVKPTEQGVVEDALAVYGWLNRIINKKKRPLVLLWGHSLGTAVASNMLAHMRELSEERGKPCPPPPDGLVLEGAFNNLMEEIECHPFSKLVSWLPYFKESFVKPFSCCSEYIFTTDKYITQVPDIPILMLHSKNDKIVPYELAVKLHKDILMSRLHGGAPVVFHTFDQCSHIGHNNLCDATGLKEIVGNFVDLLKKGV